MLRNFVWVTMALAIASLIGIVAIIAIGMIVDWALQV